MSELHDKARALLTEYNYAVASRRVTTSEAETAQIIRDLLADHERIIDALKSQLESNVSVSDHAVSETRRAIRAEAKLRELASEEPVACVCAYEGSDGIPFIVFLDPDTARRSPPDIGEPVPLIRRPEMPS